MKRRLTGYTFDASEKTVVHADFSDVTLEGIQLIVNVTDQIIIYNFADSTKGGSLSTDTLTLEYDTTSMDDADKLMILVEDGLEGASETGLEAIVTALSGTLGVNLESADIALALETGGNLDAIAASLATLDNVVSGSEAQVDVVAALPAGTNNIGDVDVLTVPADPFGANADAAATAGGTGSIQAKLRNLTSTNDAIKTAVEILDNAISGSEMQVDIVGALPAGTAAIGKLAANSGVDIGDVDVTSVIAGTGATNLGKAEDAAHNSGDTGVYMLAVRDHVPAAHSGADNDYESLHTNRDGMLWVTPGPQESDLATQATTHVKKYYTNAGAVTDGIVWSPAAGTRWYVTDIFINVSAAATVTLEDDLAGGDAVVWKAELAANSGWSHSFETPLYSGEDAADLIITTSAGNVYVTVTGYEI